MNTKTKTVYQVDSGGMLVGGTLADESPLEPGVWLMPARTVEPAPPAEWPDEKWPRWNGTSWELATKPLLPAPVEIDPVSKMTAFLEQNPDVLEYLAAKQALAAAT